MDGTYYCLFVMFILEFSAFVGKIEAPLTLVLSPGASIRENTVHTRKEKYLAEKKKVFRCTYYHFLPGGGSRLFVMVGRQFFSAPPLWIREKILVPPFGFVKKTGPPFDHPKKF